MTPKKKHMNPKFHVDFADLEIELRKSIAKDRINERLGGYIVKIVNSILLSSNHVRTYNKENLDRLRFEAFEYIVNKLLVNYDISKRTGFAFIKAMALNRIKSTKRSIHKLGLENEVVRKEYNRRTKSYDQITFLSISHTDVND